MFRTATTNKHSPTRQVRLMTDFGLKTNLSMKKVKLLILAALAVMISATSFAADADFPARPDTAIFVNDFAGVLRQSKVIDDSLRAFSKRTSNQIMVITVKDLGDYDPKMYAVELGDRWGIGQAKLDNGLIIPVADWAVLYPMSLASESLMARLFLRLKKATTTQPYGQC